MTETSIKAPFAIYAGIESLFEKIDTCHDNPEKPSTTKMKKHKVCSYSLFTYCSFDTTKNKHQYYRGEGCMKIFCKDLRKNTYDISTNLLFISNSIFLVEPLVP